ncbi:MAG: ABC transporter ATP-binding protein [Oscillospiraceae bacterium]
MRVKASAITSNKPKNLGGTFKRLYGYVRPYRFSFFCAIILSILSAVFHTLSPYILGIATDTIINGAAASLPIEILLAKLSKVLLLLAVSYVVFSVTKYFSVIIIANVSQRTMFDMRNAVDDKLKKIPLKYFDSNSYGDILSRVTNDVDTVSTSLQQSIEQMISSITSLIFIFTMMIIVSPALTLVGLVTIPFTMFASFMVIKKSQKFFKGQQASLGDLNGYVEEMINGHTIIKAFGKEEQTVNEFNKINNQLYTHAWKAQFMSGLMMPISQFFTNIGYVAVVVIGGFMIINGNFSIGKIQSFIQYLRQFSMPITQTAQIATILQSTAAAAERIFEFLDEQEEPAEVKDKKFPQNPKGEVTIEHVRFGYSQDKILIKIYKG